MLREILVPITVISCVTILSILSLDRLCQFHSEFLDASNTIEGERWLRVRCQDPIFFANLRTHTNLCFTVESNARVGAFMLALNRVTGVTQLETAASDIYLAVRAMSWPLLATAAGLFLICPSLLVSTWRTRPKRIEYDHDA